MHNFWRNVKNSIYSPEFYGSLSSRPFLFSLKYFSAVLFLPLAVFFLVVFLEFTPSFSQLVKSVDDSITEIDKAFPESLVINIENGVASSSIASAVVLPLPSSIRDIATSTFPSRLAVIDTATPFSLGTFRGYDAFLWLTRDGVVFEDKDRGVRVTGFGEAKYTLDKAELTNLLQSVRKYLRLLAGGLLPVLIVFAALSIWGWFLLYALILALLVIPIAKLRGLAVSYGHAYRIVLHAATFFILYRFIGTLLGAFIYFPFLTTIIFIVVIWINLDPEKFAKSS